MTIDACALLMVAWCWLFGVGMCELVVARCYVFFVYWFVVDCRDLFVVCVLLLYI